MPCPDSHNVIFICFCDVFLHKKAFECILNPFLISFACFTTHVFAKTVNFVLKRLNFKRFSPFS